MAPTITPTLQNSILVLKKTTTVECDQIAAMKTKYGVQCLSS